MKLAYAARSSVAYALRHLPAPVARFLRSCVERIAFARATPFSELPPVFHYWSNKYLRPRFEAFGFASPEDFFFQRMREETQNLGRPLRCLSLASGRCASEMGLIQRFVDSGLPVPRFVCLELNGLLLDAARSNARRSLVDSYLQLEAVDVSHVAEGEFGNFDVVLTNQCLHHFLELEHALDLVYTSLHPGGLLLVSDVIGRNGHQLWPEALQEVQGFWDRMPVRLRKDRTRGGSSRKYIDYDHSNVGFEGIRAQEILAALIERFEFEYCFPYGGIIMPFIERRFGWNFDVQSESDLELIDQIAKREHELLWSGAIKPTQLLASLRKERATGVTTDFPYPPSACVRHL